MIGVDYPWAMQYVWTGPDNLNSMVDMEIPGTYIVDILQDNTCQVKDTVVVEFNDCVGECKVIAPTAFSPNGDGVNDIFFVKENCPFGYDIFTTSL